MVANRMLRPFAVLLAIGLLAALLFPLATRRSHADQQTISIAPGDQLAVTCTTSLSGTVQGTQSVIACAAPAATQAPASAPTITQIKGVQEGGTLSGKVNIEAIVSGQNIATVVFKLEGAGQPAVTHTEKTAPYFFLGDNNGVPNGWDTTKSPDGDYMLTVTATNRAGQQGAAMIHFHLANQAPQPTATAQPTTQPTTAPAPTATPGTGGNETPVAGQQCPAWVHARYVTTGPDGKQYPTWHPPTDTEFGCWFGHEHGSDPHKFPGFAAIGLPAFDYTAGQMGMSEPHAGFKVFVVDDHDRGLWWMITFHQGSGSAQRAFVRHHTIDIAIAQSSDNAILANLHLMADTGGAFANCDGYVNGSGPADFGKNIPAGCDDNYESWAARASIDSRFKLDASFDIDNAITALKRLPDGSYSRTESIYAVTYICPGVDPFDPTSDCNRIGDKRGFISNELVMNPTTGDGIIWTDTMGQILPAGQGIKQFVHPSIPIALPASTNFNNGIDGGDRMIYRSLKYCVDPNNCSPRNMGDGTVRPPN